MIKCDNNSRYPMPRLRHAKSVDILVTGCEDRWGNINDNDNDFVINVI